MRGTDSLVSDGNSHIIKFRMEDVLFNSKED